MQLQLGSLKRNLRIGASDLGLVSQGSNFRDLPDVVVNKYNKVGWDTKVKRKTVASGKPLVPDYALKFVKGKSSKPFGRLWWDEIVSTVVTRPQPHNQAILHRVQGRVLTIRENARLQGFPDYYKLFGPSEKECDPIVVCELLLGLQPWQGNLDVSHIPSFAIMLVGAAMTGEGWSSVATSVSWYGSRRVGLRLQPSRLFDLGSLKRNLRIGASDLGLVSQGSNFRDLPDVVVNKYNKVGWDTKVKRKTVASGKPLVPDYALKFVKGKSSK
nr:DNA (cytosine-5)-methyltransferase CMT3-like isoform X2 [Tanacetum cinerariifolium]